MMWYVYLNSENEAVYSHDKPEGIPFATVERMPPMPNKPGYETRLAVDTETARVYYEFTPIEPTIDQLKERKLEAISAYDSSSAVNSFSVNGLSIWLDKDTRSGLRLRFEAEQATGKTNTTLWYDTTEIPLPLTTAVQMLYALERYASECYDTTQRHRAAVGLLTTAEEIQAYDITTGYPAKLEF